MANVFDEIDALESRNVNVFDSVENEKPEGTMQDAIAEPLEQVAGSVAGMVAGGLGGIYELIKTGDLDSAANAVRSMQQDITKRFAPTTQAGEAGMENVSDAMQYLDENVVRPVAGAAFGGAMALRNTSLDEGADAYQEVQDKGLSNAMGDRVMERTGNLGLSEATRSAIPVGEALLPLGVTNKATGAIRSIPKNPTMTELTKNALTPFTGQGKAKQRMSDLLQKPEIPDEAVGFNLQMPPEKKAKTSFEKFKREILRVDEPKVVKNPYEQEALRQGFDIGALGDVKRSSPETKNKMTKMVDTVKSIKEIKSRAQFMNPGNVVGDAFLERINKVLTVNKNAGQRVGAEATKLRGSTVDFDPLIDDFTANLDSLGIDIKPDKSGKLMLDFKGSDVQGLSGVEGSLRKVFNRMRDTGKADAYDLHRIKQYIDQVVTYGKNKSGLSGSGERVLKVLRSDIKGLLDANFEDYAKANLDYSETINALDAVQDIGKKIDFTSDTAGGRLGNQLRKLTSHYNSQYDITDALKMIDDLAVKHGGEYNDNIFQLNMFNDELKNVFGTTRRNSMEGIQTEAMKQAMKGGIKDIAIDKAAKILEESRGINEQGAFDAISELLKQQ